MSPLATVYTGAAEGQSGGRGVLEPRCRDAYSPRMDGVTPADLYERDFYAWTQDQAARLRALAGRDAGLDAENIAEEIESLGRSDRRAASSLIGNIIETLLKMRFHPAQEHRAHRRSEVRTFRNNLERILKDSPSLRARRHEIAAEMWGVAARDFLDRLEAAGHDQRPARAAIGDLDQPFLDLDAEVLNEEWFPDPPG